jgi:hypothetical protein
MSTIAYQHEQMRRKLWCDIYARSIAAEVIASEATSPSEVADEAVRAFDARFPNLGEAE